MAVQLPDYTGAYFSAMASQNSRSTPSGNASGSRLGASGRAGEESGKPGNDDGDKTEGADGTSGSGDVIDAVFGDPSDKNVSMEDFLTLMVAQLKNQDFMNPMDDTQYITQLAQISTMQQMEEMAYNAKSTYVTSLVGKTVTAAKFTVAGDLKKTTGMVDKVSLLDGKFVIYVAGESYDMDEIMEIKAEAAAGNEQKPGEEEETPPEDANEKGPDET